MKKIIILFLGAAVFVSLWGIKNESQAFSLILKRVVLEGPKRAEVLTIINKSNQEKTYRLGWKTMVMGENTGVKAIKPDNVDFNVPPSKDMVRFSPRRVTIPPKSSQQIRLILRAPSDMADGEYRSHLSIRQEADVEKIRAENPEVFSVKPGKSKVAVSLLPGVTLPVIVRKGDLSVDVSISEFSAVDAGKTIDVSLSMIREGGKSTYGDIDFACNLGASDAYPLRSTRGVAIYTEITRKNMKMKIKKSSENPKCRELSVRYVETENYAGKDVRILSQASAVVQ